MYEFLVNNANYVVFTIVFTIWVGIAYYLFRLEQKITQLEKKQ